MAPYLLEKDIYIKIFVIQAISPQLGRTFIMKKLVFLLLTIHCLIPGLSFAALQDIHLEWTHDYEPVEGRTLAGYFLYKDGVKVCTTNTPAARAIDCSFESDNGTFNFTLTVFCTDGYESPHSTPYTFTLLSEPPLLAAVTTTPTSLSGDAPFQVSFDGSASTGNITSYSWDFGDSNSAGTMLATHTYLTAGTYTATLTVTDSSGATSQKSVTVTVAPAPVAAITTTPASLSGDTPFNVSFDGSASTGEISSYSWDFGDSSSGSGSQITHSFTTAGTYTTTLTVTSANGSTSQKSVTVTVAPAPVAAFTTTPAILSGEAPFNVSFDGSASTGEITSYNWDFGDSSSGSGSQVSHTYDAPGTYTATLTVMSSNGTSSQSSVTVNATSSQTLSTYSIHLEWTYDYQPIEGRVLAGYYLYKEGVKICTSTNPADRAMDCSFESQEGTFDFTLTAFCTDGFESPHSDPYTFTLSSTSNPEFAAVINTTPATLSGDVPFTVLFDGSASIGAASYAWVFGDGGAATTSQAEHTFTAAGTYTTTLTISDGLGQINATNVTVTVNEVPVENSPPTPVISTSTSMGEAPFTVSFDGSDSYDADGTISSWLWNFGDGSSTVTGATATHSYTVAGTYSASLKVTDNQGAANSITTPIIITSPTVENQAPTASLTASVTEGTTPLEVIFDGSASTDPEESPLTYSWNFGDGSSGQGATVSHTYTSPGTFTATLTVTDDSGATATTATVITALDETPIFQIELGEVDINHNWTRVEFSDPFTNPIVVAGPLSSNGDDPSTIRLKNISTTGFDIRVQEWDYLDGGHITETVAYLVMEQGSFILDNGAIVEAGQFSSTDSDFNTVPFKTTFSTEPIVMASVATFNDAAATTSRLRNISTTSFEHKTQEQESSSNRHGNETVNYIAWEPSHTSMGNITAIVDKTADKVRNRWYTIDFDIQLPTIPIFLGAMQSQDGLDPSTIRHRNKSHSELEVMVVEEQSEDDETRHTSETVGYFLFYTN